MTTTKTLNIRNLVLIAMMAAIAMVLMLFEVPLPMIAPSFYEIDLSELPVLIGTFAMGPVAGVLIELVKILLKLLIKGTSTAYVGDLANFLVGCSFLLPAGIIYHMKKTKKSAIIGMIAGTVTMAVAGRVPAASVLCEQLLRQCRRHGRHPGCRSRRSSCNRKRGWIRYPLRGSL